MVFHPVATDFAARCSTCVQSVANYVNVESSVEKVPGADLGGGGTTRLRSPLLEENLLYDIKFLL